MRFHPARLITVLATVAGLLYVLATGPVGPVNAVTGSAKSNPQKLFTQALLDDQNVDDQVKDLLRNGGFVDKRMLFADLTGEGKTDVVVTVHSSGSSGAVAAYILSARSGTKLRALFRLENRFQLRVEFEGTDEGVDAVLIDEARYSAGDMPCCSARRLRNRVVWNSSRQQFVIKSRRILKSK